MKILLNWCVLVLSIVLFSKSVIQAQPNKSLIDLSRNSTVRVITTSGSGTGFFIDNKYVVTCFHVIAKVEINKDIVPNQMKIDIAKDLKIRLISGEEVDVEYALPGDFTKPLVWQKPYSLEFIRSVMPWIDDFAVLRLKSTPRTPTKSVSLFSGTDIPEIGTEVILSGYSLKAPGMLTHKGFISGIFAEDIGIQAPVNKGNSGGALLNDKGEVIGIVYKREGSISEEVGRFFKEIEDMKKMYTVTIGGVDPYAGIQNMIKSENENMVLSP